PSWTSAASASKTTSSSPTPPPRSSPPQSPDRLLGSASLPNEDCLVRRSLLSASEPAPERGGVFVRGDPASGPTLEYAPPPRRLRGGDSRGARPLLPQACGGGGLIESGAACGVPANNQATTPARRLGG